MKIGLIDIGSNSIRTMTAARDAAVISYGEKRVYTTRLAEGLAETGCLGDTQIMRSLAVIRTFVSECSNVGLPVYAYATSAVRDAVNREAFSAAVRALTGGRLSVLSGEEEARYAYLGATGGRGGLIDIGGGSTQIVTENAARSFPIGCVRAKNLCGGDGFDGIRRALSARLDALLDVSGLDADCWTGVGGTITTLGALCLGLSTYERATVNGAVVTYAELENELLRLSALGDAKRATIPLLSVRHDVILYGGAILLYEMKRLGARQLTVSDADGMEGFAAAVLAHI